MPYGILHEIASSEEKTGKSGKSAKRIAFATANKMGFMHGSKETALGRKKEKKFEKEHPEKSHSSGGWGKGCSG